MDAKNYFLKRYKDRISTTYDEAKEIQLASFDGWDMIDFAQGFYEEALKNMESSSRIIESEFYCIESDGNESLKCDTQCIRCKLSPDSV